jgi:NADPH-dependent ferric siderophore reductase
MTTLDAATASALLNSPKHRAGLNDLVLEVTSVSRRHPWLARVSGRVPGLTATDPTAWRHPNIALRLAIPDPSDDLGPLIGQPGLCRRVYTVADVDPDAGTVDIDIVVHGGASPMMRWLDALRPGDRVDFAGPRPHPAPTGAAAAGDPVYLLADGSAYPAASAITRACAVTTVVLAPPDAAERPDPARFADDFPGARILVAGESATPLADALATLSVPSGATVWAAGEREDIRSLRTRCLGELGLPKKQVQVFGYWRRGKTGTDADIARLTGIARLRERGLELTGDNDFDIEI